MSRSRKVLMKPSRHARLSSSRSREERSREPAAQPQRLELLRPRLADVEARQLHELHAAGQGLGHPAHYVWRGAAENQKTCPVVGPIDQDSQHAEQLRHDLNLVENHHTVQRTQNHLRVLQTLPVGTRFQVEMRDPSPLGENARQRGLTALPRSEQGRHRRTSSGIREAGQINASLDHSPIFP